MWLVEKNGDGQKDTKSSPLFVDDVKLNPGYNNEVIYVWTKRLMDAFKIMYRNRSQNRDLNW